MPLNKLRVVHSAQQLGSLSSFPSYLAEAAWYSTRLRFDALQWECVHGISVAHVPALKHTDTINMEPDLVFQKALDNFKKDLTAQQRQEFSITKLQDVKDEVNKIQIQHGSAKKLRGMSRMSKFLEAMQQLEQVISVFLNVSEVVAFIWVSAVATSQARPVMWQE